jgi:hypothetical protein
MCNSWPPRRCNVEHPEDEDLDKDLEETVKDLEDEDPEPTDDDDE